MPSIYVKFKGFNPIHCAVDDTALGNKYVNLVKANYKKSSPVFRDREIYTEEYMRSLSEKAAKLLGWQWESNQYSLDITAKLHKDLETTLGSSGGFDNVAEDVDEIIHELHQCLHAIQNGKRIRRDGWLQIEWYNDSGFKLPDTSTFKRDLAFGDLRLQNPYVGHGPLQLFLEKDFSNISQTCKFHDFVKPGINISVTDIFCPVSNRQIVDTIKHHCPEFVELHGEDTVMSYIGHPVIGRVTNPDDLADLVNAKTLDLEFLDFQ